MLNHNHNTDRGFLTLSRKLGEVINIGDNATIKLTAITDEYLRLLVRNRGQEKRVFVALDSVEMTTVMPDVEVYAQKYGPCVAKISFRAPKSISIMRAELYGTPKGPKCPARTMHHR